MRPVPKAERKNCVNLLFCWCESCQKSLKLMITNWHTHILNKEPVIWFSKCQSTVESLTYRSKMIALKTTVKMIQGLWFKLRSFSVPIEGPDDVFCLNEAITNAASKPEATLSKKHNSMTFHKVWEATAMKMIRVAWEDMLTNLADLLTKMKTRA